MKKTIKSDLVRGNIDTIILKALYDGDRYGKDIISEVEQKSSGQYVLKQATLYSCLKRLEEQGQIRSYLGAKVQAGIGGRRKYYTLTDLGREVFTNHQTEWEYSRTVIDKLISDREFDLSRIESPLISEPATVGTTLLDDNEDALELETLQEPLDLEETVEQEEEERFENPFEDILEEENDDALQAIELHTTNNGDYYENEYSDNLPSHDPFDDIIDGAIDTESGLFVANDYATQQEFLDPSALLRDIKLASDIEESYSESIANLSYTPKSVITPATLRAEPKPLPQEELHNLEATAPSSAQLSDYEPQGNALLDNATISSDNLELEKPAEENLEDDATRRARALKALYSDDELETENIVLNEDEPQTNFSDYRENPTPLLGDDVDIFSGSDASAKSIEEDGDFLSYSTRVNVAKDNENDVERYYQDLLSKLVKQPLEEISQEDLQYSAYIPPSQDMRDASRIVEQTFAAGNLVEEPPQEPPQRHHHHHYYGTTTTEYVSDNSSQLQLPEGTNTHAQIIESDYSEDITIRTHSIETVQEHSEKYYYYCNRLMLVHYLIMFGIMAAFIATTFLIAMFGVNTNGPSVWPQFNILVYVVFIALTAMLPIIAAVVSFKDADKKKRINYSFKNALKYRLVLFVNCLVLTYLINVYLGMNLSMNNASDHLVSLLLPALMALCFPISSFVFNSLYKSGKYAVKS